MIVGRATTYWKVYRDKDKSKVSLIIKDLQQYKERFEKGEFIKKATNKGVRNIIQYFYYETVQVDKKNNDTSENIRKRLIKKYGRIFKKKSFIDFKVLASESLRRALISRIQSRNALRKRLSSLTRMAPLSAKRSCLNLRVRNSGTLICNRIR